MGAGAPEIWVRGTPGPILHDDPVGPDTGPATSCGRTLFPVMSRPPRRPKARPRRDRHGRGLRGRLVPAEVPLARSRAEQFDDLVLDAVEDIERRWERELAGVEFAVEDVPWVEHTSPDEVVPDADVLDDGSIPLARVLPAHRENGREVPPRIVVYRRPLEIRAHDREDLADLVRDVVVDQIAVLLGRDPEEIDPTG